jgi:Flp pilus assembly protein TadD
MSFNGTGFRTLLAAALLAGYASLFLHVSAPVARRTFDPLEPRGRQVELAIETGRFADALPVARMLHAEYPTDLTVLYWMGEIYRGLGRAADEAASWQEYARHSGAPEAACPFLPIALAKSGDEIGALQAYERCVRADRDALDDPEQWRDLAVEYERRGRMDLAHGVYRQHHAGPMNHTAAHQVADDVEGSVPK